jgi:threonine aldolase
MELNFRSDNESPAAAEILDAVVEANRGAAWSYAKDQWSAQLNAAFSELFGIATTVVPLCTGTAVNSIALATVTPPWGSVYCHEGAHILQDEGGAPEFFGNGLRLVGVAGANGKLNAADLRQALRDHEGEGVHSYLASALSLTQSTEAGTLYQPDQIAALCDVAKEFNMARHMDGARFANAVAALGCAPASITWQAGVQMLSFGASKNGCLAAEALLFFGETQLQQHAERLRKRSGHLLSKMRFVSAQLLAYIKDDRWLTLASHANRQAAQFAGAVRAHPQAELEFTADANEVFVRWSASGFAALAGAGVQFLAWPGRSDLARFVFSHCTSDKETEVLCQTLQSLKD